MVSIPRKIQSTSHEQFAQLNPVPAHPMPKFFGLTIGRRKRIFHHGTSVSDVGDIPICLYIPMVVGEITHEKSMIGWINCYF